MRATRLSVVGAVTVVAAALAGCGSGSRSPSAAPSAGPSAASRPSTQGQTTLRIASNTNMGALPVWTAIDEGIFAKHGLTVKFTQVNNVGILPPQLNKTFDIALVTPAGAIEAASKGIPVTEVAGAYTDTVKKPDSFLMVKKGSNITSLSQLKGKTIGALTIAGTLNYATLNMLEKAGVPAASVKVINVDGPQQLAQLQSGRIDAVETLLPFSSQIKSAGGVSLGIPFQSIAPTISVIWWGANPAWASKHANVINKFRASLRDAIKFIKTNPSKAQTIGAKYADLPASLVSKAMNVDFNPAVRPQDISKWIGILRRFGNFKGNVDPSKLVFQP